MRRARTNVKLSEYEVDEIKEVYQDMRSYAATARAVNVSAGVVSQIIRGKGRFSRK